MCTYAQRTIDHSCENTHTHIILGFIGIFWRIYTYKYEMYVYTKETTKNIIGNLKLYFSLHFDSPYNALRYACVRILSSICGAYSLYAVHTAYDEGVK